MINKYEGGLAGSIARPVDGRVCYRDQWSQRCRGQRHGSRGSMSDMTSILHQSVAINSKGGYFLLRLVFIDVNP
jgi:hypothetical protein